MQSFFKSNLTLILSTLFIFAVSAEAATKLPVVSVSGGEEHTLVLGENGNTFACGKNSSYQLGIDSSDGQSTLVPVHDGDMNTSSGYLENIAEVAAGWTHSLFLTNDKEILASGNNYLGQLGTGGGEFDNAATPVYVVSGEQDANDPNSLLEYIIDISTGRSGLHSLAVDANHFCYT